MGKIIKVDFTQKNKKEVYVPKSWDEIYKVIQNTQREIEKLSKNLRTKYEDDKLEKWN